MGKQEGYKERRNGEIVLPRRSRRQNRQAVLGKVSVKGEGIRDTKPLHHRKARGIGEGKLFVIVLADDSSCPGFISNADADNGRRTVVYAAEGAERNGAAEPSKQERVGFGDYQVRGVEPPALRDKALLDGQGRVMISIPWCGQGKEG